MSARTATIDRTTAETDVRLTLTLDGSGAGKRSTGVGFLDHMLDLPSPGICKRARTTPPRTPRS
jgi:imidazoleglycerol phosphate dehydratase HisB